MDNTSPPVLNGEQQEMSLGARLMNVFVTPSEVFSYVKTAKRSTANWLAPVLLSCLVSIIYSFVVFSQPAIVQQLREQHDRQIDKMVQAGKMSASQAESAKTEMEKFMGPSFYKLTGSVMGVIMSFAWVFLVGMGLWLLGAKILKGRFDYMQAVEMTSLSNLIMVLATLVTMFLAVAKGTILVSPGPALFLGEIDPANKIHLVLLSLNVFVLWYIGVMSIGLARLSGMSTIKAALWLYGFWVLVRAVVIFKGWGASGM